MQILRKASLLILVASMNEDFFPVAKRQKHRNL